MGFEEINEDNIKIIISDIEPRDKDIIDHNFSIYRNTSKIIPNNKVSDSLINKWFKYENYFLENKHLHSYRNKTPNETFIEYCKILCKNVEDFDIDLVLGKLKPLNLDVNIIKSKILYYKDL